MIGGIAHALKAPRESSGIVDDEAHARPWLIKSLILRPRSLTPLLASRKALAARLARALSYPEPVGTSLAIALPRRVITISPPRSTWSRSALNLFLTSDAPTSLILNSPANCQSSLV